jgi:lysophospholipase L1-like esterase
MAQTQTWTPKYTPTAANQITVLFNGSPATLSAAVSVKSGTVSFSVAKAGEYKVTAATPTGTISETFFISPKNKTVAIDNALIKLRASVAGRDTRPVVIAFAGSSTVAGTGAATPGQRAVNLVSDSIQAVYPTAKPTAVRTLAQALAAAPLPNGLHFVNAGVGGTLASNYLTATTGSQLATLNPNAVVHVVGSNDFASNIPVTDYKANLQARIAQLKASATVPQVHILIHAHERRDVVGEYAWEDYGTAMQDIAEADPENVVFLDTTPFYAAIGFPATDALGYFSGDNIHLSTAGHAYFADLICASLEITPERLKFPTYRVASDSFAGTNSTDISGRALDAGLGGGVRSWTSAPAAAFGITSNALVMGGTPTAAFLSVPVSSPNVEIALTVTTKPSAANGVYLDVRREGSALSGTSSSYRALIADTTVVLQKRVSGATTVLGTNVLYNTGDRVALRAVGDRIDLMINGVIVDSVNDSSVPSGPVSGIAVSGSSPYVLEDFTVNVVDPR